MVWSESGGRSGASVLSLPKWTLFVRIFQLVLAFIMLVLTAYSASKLGSGVRPIFSALFISCYKNILYLPFEMLADSSLPCSGRRFW